MSGKEPADELRVPTQQQVDAALKELAATPKGPTSEIIEENGRRFEVVTHHPTGTGVYTQHALITRTELPPEVPDFVCPNCGAKEFRTQMSSGANRGPQGFVCGPPQGPTITARSITGYSCSGCSTQFNDPRLFSKNRPRP